MQRLVCCSLVVVLFGCGETEGCEEGFHRLLGPDGKVMGECIPIVSDGGDG